ncbi:MAG: aspartate ammonia-lyase [Desulfobacteraceae bacterium]|nr:aspartate ammonia-lyase [Desulfobacteraceae bacterium]
MVTIDEILNDLSKDIGINKKDLNNLLLMGKTTTYSSEDWIFRESTPRTWAGFVIDGEVSIIRGLHGVTRELATLKPGAVISESAFLDQRPHSTSAFTQNGATILELSIPILKTYRQENPESFYRIVASVAEGISERLQRSSERYLAEGGEEQIFGESRLEKDSLGERVLPGHVYYGIQTLRAMENFSISGIRVKNFEHLIKSLAFVKKAAAMANHELEVLDKDRMQAICQACDEIIEGKFHDQFMVDMFQGGAGTSTNMMANEIIANRGLEILGQRKGDYSHLHPNDHLNCSQSTNDVYPTAIKLAVLLSLEDLLAAMSGLTKILEIKAEEFSDVLKMGRTENQDAVPMTLGQEFSAYAVMIESAARALKSVEGEFHDINMGATAIGTGINSPPGYSSLVTQKLSEVSGFSLRRARNLVEATQNAGAFVQMSATLKRAAVSLSKICNDLRWMSSGPRCGLNEINLPSMQPGSSIMPGKVNPVIPELVNQICYQIIGYDAVVSMAAEASEMELCMAEPIIAYDLLHGMLILKNACITLTSRCIAGIEANRDVCRGYVENSIGLVTALVPVLGYEKSAAIAKEALKTGKSVYELVLHKEWMTKEKLDDMLRPENMTDPREISK